MACMHSVEPPLSWLCIEIWSSVRNMELNWKGSTNVAYNNSCAFVKIEHQNPQEILIGTGHNASIYLLASHVNWATTFWVKRFDSNPNNACGTWVKGWLSKESPNATQMFVENLPLLNVLVFSDLVLRLLKCKLVLLLLNFSCNMGLISAKKTTADNTGLRSLYIQHHEHYRTQHLKDNPDCDDIHIKHLPADDLFWRVNTKIGEITSETLFQGYTLQQLVDAGFEYVDVKAQDRRAWAFYLQKRLLSESIGNYEKNFKGDKGWGVTWNMIRLGVLVTRGEIVDVELIPRVPATSSAGATHSNTYDTAIDVMMWLRTN